MSKTSEKINLFFFVTPRVIQNPKEANSVFESKKKQIDELREAQIKLYRGEYTDIAPPSIEESLPDASVPETQPDAGADSTSAPPIDPESLPAAISGPYSVQVHAFADQQSAMDATARLAGLGHPAKIVETDIDGKIWYRVQIGNGLELDSARGIRDRLIQQGYRGILILRSKP
jgi:general secretion pathway protein D